MAKEIEVENIIEFEEIINNKDIRVSKALVETILKNLKGRKKEIPALSIKCRMEGDIYDICVSREDFILTLESNLPIMEREEMFEECGEIIKAIKYLKNKKKK